MDGQDDARREALDERDERLRLGLGAGRVPRGELAGQGGPQLRVGKLRLRSTPRALQRRPRSAPSGLADSTTAHCSASGATARRAAERATVVSGSLPWMAANTSARGARPRGSHTCSGTPAALWP